MAWLRMVLVQRVEAEAARDRHQDRGAAGFVLGLQIFTPTPEYLLAMKVLANRAPDDDKNLTDATDAVALMKLTGINTYEKIVELMEQCYPNIPGISFPPSPRE